MPDSLVPDSRARTAAHLDALAAGGADVIELGVPFSDPIADGPVNQRAAVRALAAGTKLSAILQLVARHRDKLGIPIVLFTYFNPIHARGVERFAEQAAASGVDGVLCVDLPPEEGERDFIPAMRAQGVDTIFLLAPTSTRERVDKGAAASSGFVYYVSRTGVTGERAALPSDLVRDVKKLRKVFEADPGASYVGEWSLGCNPRVLHPMRDILFDEKIAGSFHLTPGNAYDEADNGNRSKVHWDLVQIQRPEYGGGTIAFDGVPIRVDGRFIPEELRALDPE